VKPFQSNRDSFPKTGILPFTSSSGLCYDARVRGLTSAAQIGFLAALCLAAAPASLPATSPSARSAVQAAIDEFLSVLRDSALSAEQRGGKIKESAARHVAFDTLARLSLGPPFRSLTAEQQAEFTAELRKHIQLIASRSVSKYDQEEVTITGDRPEANGDWTVLTRITRKRDPRRRHAPVQEVGKVDFRLRRIDGQWKAIDIIIQNISLAGTFRAQFNAILKDNDIERLIQILREKNAASERAEEAESAGGRK
jgi:phospholipid transport system substrate-binding protein